MPVAATAVVAPMVDVVSPATLEEGEKSEWWNRRLPLSPDLIDTDLLMYDMHASNEALDALCITGHAAY